MPVTLGNLVPVAPAIPGGESQAVGLGEIKVGRRTGEVVAYSLGSCVAICLYDPAARIAAMAHVVLPAAPAAGAGAVPGKYADTAVPAIVDELRRAGANLLRLRCHIAGGAAVLALGGGGSLPKIGERNIEAVKLALSSARLRVLNEETGGTQGRTVRLDVETGRVLVRSVKGTVTEL